MSARDGTVNRSVSLPRLCVALLLGLAACLPLQGRSPVQAAAPLRAQPALLQLAAAHPDAQVGVIVQLRDAGQSVNWGLDGLGARVTRRLPIIHALAVRLPARSVPRLAAMPGVRWVSLDAPVVKSSYSCCNAATLNDVYPQSIGAGSLWSQYQGQGVGVAVVDSGMASAIEEHMVAMKIINSRTTFGGDPYGHGTHVAGIIGGNGANSAGAYIGVAPQANLIDVKISDDQGMASVSDVVNGLQWVYNNRTTGNIRVVNLSLNSTVADSYQVDPLDAAVETLWNAGIVVVVSAGNNGNTNAGVLFAPANDPFAITVGAVNDQGTVNQSDDTLASFSSFGTIPISTTAGLTSLMNKPDLVAPGVNIVSVLASPSDTLATAHPANIVNSNYFRMSGTSMAAPMVSGAVALLLQAQPGLTPNQVKYRLTATASPVASTSGVGAGEVNVAAAVANPSTASANVGVAPAASIQTGNPAASWGSASWGSASWGSASWGSASWGSASWGSASWGSASWGSASWGSASWGSDYWG